MGQVAELKPPAVDTGMNAPVRKLDSQVLRTLGHDLNQLFTRYVSDRQLTEKKWMRNLRQYLGIYDPDVDSQIPKDKSRAYPRITRVKCISVLARIMNLMFPGNERNWQLNASPSAQMNPEDVQQAVQELMAARQADGVDSELSEELVDAAVQRLAEKRADKLSLLIDDQLQEIGGNQTLDYVSLNRKVAMSGILYGVGYLEGPYVRMEKKVQWGSTTEGGFAPIEREIRKPQYEFSSVWDTYIDMSSRCPPGDGYFLRKVMGKKDLRKLADRPDFFADQIKEIIRRFPQGNYTPREFETELRTMGTRAHINDRPNADLQGNKFEVIVWKGPVSAQKLEQLGADVPDKYKADDIDAEVWLVGADVIKADINSWRKLGMDEVQTLHTFLFDEDDTSPIGNGLPNVMRDSQMSIAAATRMALDNASVVCGPNLEVNMSLMMANQDVSSVTAYKVWYRDDEGLTAQFPAIREIKFDGHLNELQQLVEMFMKFADLETFVGPATGGDMEKAPSEPMRTAAGASMLRGDAALPFKDIVRNFDFFTQSVILSLVQFNRKFNPGLAPEGDYCVVARGATSLIAKEIRGMQLDQMAQMMTDEERDHVDERKFVEQRFAVRDMDTLLLPAEEAERKKQARATSMGQMNELQMQTMQAEIRKTLAEAFKNITQGQKNSAAADAQTSNAALAILTSGMEHEEGSQGADR
jgi:hypothetical protein